MKQFSILFKRVEQRVPHIPDFGDLWNILKIFIVSTLLVAIYTFSQIYSLREYGEVFLINLKIFMPYLITQLLLLIFFAKIIKSVRPFNSIIIILLLNFICVYLIHAAMTRSFENFFTHVEGSLIKLAFSYGIVFFFLIYFDWREKSSNPAETLARLSFLQSKMRPHFLFNTINSIASLIKKDPELARKILVNLAEILRASLNDISQNSHTTIKEDIGLCKKYLEIEKMRLGSRLDVVWDVDEVILECIVPKLSVQPLVENSILHGIQHLESGGIININIKKINNYIKIAVSNPKPKEEKINEKSNHIGLSNLRERLNIFFKHDVEFELLDDTNKFSVSIVIPQSKLL